MRTCCSKIVCSAIGSGSHRRSAISRHLVSACTAAGIFECTHRATRTVLGSYRQLWASYHSNGISPDTSHVASTVLNGRVSTANPTEAELPYLTKQLESEIPDCSGTRMTVVDRETVNRYSKTRKSYVRHYLPCIANVISAIQNNQLLHALRIFRSIEMTNPSDLANLPTEYFTMLISMVLFNKNRVVATMSSAQRLDNAHMILELMKKHGVVQNLSTIIVAVNIYGRLRDLQAVEASYNYAKQHGFRINDHSLLAGMCHAHILNGNDLRGRWFFEQLRRRDSYIYPYNVLIRAYSRKGDESGIFSVLGMMSLAGIKPNARTVSLICNFYYQLGDYKVILKHIAMFSATGGTLTLELNRLFMQASNSCGDYQAVIARFAELYAEKNSISGEIYNEVLIAAASIGDTENVWSYYNSTTDFNCIDSLAQIALAKMVGPLHDAEAILDFNLLSSYACIPLLSILFDLITGFSLLGDVPTVKALADEWIKFCPEQANSVYAKILFAYSNNGDADGALTYIHGLAAKSKERLDFSIWYAALSAVASHKPEALKELTSYLQLEYPDVTIDNVVQKLLSRHGLIK
ncbi:hypothetical protein BASA83_010562 [Batrachochytrium salamandrivorans]|nr:hypothetical protein BASA62_001318 [Batrachochytrium salamandrivorans]KAH9266444.1 hypothetical protein BASA83_010562 [Batrachochytrium salamandrivorans]